RVTVYLPGSIPREKYSPFLLVFRLKVRPLSLLCQTTWASVIGLPWASLQAPFTVPVCAEAGTIQSTATTANNQMRITLRFIQPSRPGRPRNGAVRPSITFALNLYHLRSRSVRKRINGTRVSKRPQAKHAAVTHSAGPIFAAVT